MNAGGTLLVQRTFTGCSPTPGCAHVGGRTLPQPPTLGRADHGGVLNIGFMSSCDAVQQQKADAPRKDWRCCRTRGR